MRSKRGFMPYKRFMLIFFLLLHLLSACEQATSSAGAGYNLPVRSPQDTALHQISPRYAQHFEVSYHSNYKVAHLHFNSEARGIGFDQKIVLLQRGTPAPALSGELSEAWLVEVPVRTVAANDDGEITRLAALGLGDQIVAMGGGGIYDPTLRRRWEEKEIASIGYSFHRAPQPETLLALEPDLLLLYAYDHQRLESLERCRQLGINAIPHFAWAEPSFLGKAEWLKFTALFFNKEKEAEQLFTEIANRCEELTQMASAQSDTPEAFMLYYPSSESDWSAHRNDFYASFLSAAGATNVLADTGPTHPVGMNNEQLLAKAKEADFWFVNSTNDADWPPAAYLHAFRSYREKNVFHYQKRTRYEHNAYDWYETPEVRPDLVLEDLVAIFYPALLPDHELLFFDRVELSKYQENLRTD